MPSENISSVVSDEGRSNTTAPLPCLRLSAPSGINAEDGLLRDLRGAFKVTWRRLTTSLRTKTAGREEEIRELSRRLIHAHEEERLRLARELHDDVAQRVAVVAAELTALVRQSDDCPAGIGTRLVKLSRDVAVIGGDIHRLSHHLHPVILKQIGLGSAIRVFCRELSETRHVKIDLRLSQLPRDVDRDVALCLYRIVQEALHNAVQHGRVSSAVVILVATEHDIVLSVLDRGVGFDPNASTVHASLGLTSMRERARLVNGQFSLWSKTGQGTRIEVRVPRHAGR